MKRMILAKQAEDGSIDYRYRENCESIDIEVGETFLIWKELSLDFNLALVSDVNRYLAYTEIELHNLFYIFQSIGQPIPKLTTRVNKMDSYQGSTCTHGIEWQEINSLEEFIANFESMDNSLYSNNKFEKDFITSRNIKLGDENGRDTQIAIIRDVKDMGSVILSRIDRKTITYWNGSKDNPISEFMASLTNRCQNDSVNRL